MHYISASRLASYPGLTWSAQDDVDKVAFEQHLREDVGKDGEAGRAEDSAGQDATLALGHVNLSPPPFPRPTNYNKRKTHESRATALLPLILVDVADVLLAQQQLPKP